MNDNEKSVVAVIPAYNEASSIRTVIEQTLEHLDHVVVVDDGSTDGTLDLITELPITILQNERNVGKAASLMRGFSHALDKNATAVISLDADTQHDPAEIPNFLSAMQAYPDHFIIGARLRNRHMAPKHRLRANQVADFFISWAAGHRVIDSQSGYRLYPAALLEECLLRYADKGKFVFESDVLIHSTRRGFMPASIAIESIYPASARPSHFRPVLDTTKIGAMVAWKIISHGFCLPGLYRTLFKSGKLL